MASGDSQGPVNLKDREESTPSAAYLDEQFGGDFSKRERRRVDSLSSGLSQNDAQLEEAEDEEPETPEVDTNPTQDEPNWKTNLKKNNQLSLGERLKTAKGLWMAGAGMVTCVSLVVGLLAIIQPFKADFIIKSIEARVGEIPQNAIDHRMEFYMSRYLMLRAAENAGIDFSKDRSYTYIGNGVFNTLYTNWRGAKLETTLEKDYGIRIKPKPATGQLLGRNLVKPSSWDVEYVNVIDRATGKPRIESFDAPKMRQAIRDYARAETKSHQVLKRYHMRKVLKRYWGVNNWKPFEKSQDKVRDKYREVMTKTKKFFVNQTVGRFSQSRAATLNCILEGGESCDERNLNPRDQGGGAPDAELDRAIEDSVSNGDNRALTEGLQKIGLKKVLSLAGYGVGILAIFGALDKSAETGALSHATFNTLSSGYIGYATAMRSASDQILSGEDFDPEAAQVLSDILKGYETSPVYLAAAGAATGAGGAVAMQYVRDCGNGNIKLPPGELVCPNRKLIQNKEAFTNSPFWYPIHVIGSTFNSTLGKPLEWFSEITSSLLESVGVTQLISTIVQHTKLGDAANYLIQQGLTMMIGYSVTGNEIGPDAYDAIYAGISATQSSLGSPIGGNRDDSIGGEYLSNERVTGIREEQLSDEQYALSRKSMFERYLSPDVSNSLTSYAIMHAPTSTVTLASSFMAAINPVNILGTIGSIFTARSSALATNGTLNNPFGAIQYGYANNDPVLTMDDDEINAKYHCDLPTDERPQNKRMGRPEGMPFDILTDSDPCLLNKATEKAGSMFFTGAYENLDN